MTYRGHLVGGALAAAAVIPRLPLDLPQQVIAVALCLVAALAPDLDTPGSALARTLGPLRFLIWLLPISHRGVSHSLFATLVVTALVGWGLSSLAQPLWLAAAVAAGYASHLVLDAMTVSGVPLLAPVSDRRIHLLPRPLRWHTR